MLTPLDENLQKIKFQKDNYIVPDNIKSGINILGVIGDYRGEVKLFTTETQMNADTNKHEGDLAIVYSNTWDNITDTTVFSSCIFPSRVSLPSTITSTVSLGFSSISQSPTFNATGRLTRNSFGITFNTGNGSLINIEYSGMGRSYSRTDGGSEIVDFGESIQWSSNLTWDSAIGYFMQVNNVYFGGLYEVKNNSGTLEYVHIAP